MKKTSLVFSCLLLLLLGAAGPAIADPVSITIYNGDQPGWLSAVGNVYQTEDFADTTLNEGVKVDRKLTDHINKTVGGVRYWGLWFDVIYGNKDGWPHVTPVTTTWTFDPPITAFGANWDMSTNGAGPGLALTVVFNTNPSTSQDLLQEIPRTFIGNFFGFTSPVPVRQVTAKIGNQPGAGDPTRETHTMDNLVFVPVPATHVELTSFTAKGAQEGVDLEWKTASEIDNAGFNLWRSQKQHGKYINITEDALIPAKGTATTAASYSYTDTDVVLGKKYFYKLQDIDIKGAFTFNGPVSAAAGEIILIFPEENAQLDDSSPVEFKWDGTGFDLFQLQLCNRSDFKKGAIVLPMTGKRWISDSSYTPGAKEWNKIKQLGRNGKMVYWRVNGKNESGNVLSSKVSGFKIQ